MSNDKTPPFDVVAAFQTLLQSSQQLLQGQNEIMRLMTKIEGHLLVLENHCPQFCATGSTHMHVFTADLVTPTQQMDVFTVDLVTPTQQMHVFTTSLSDSLCIDVKLHKHSNMQHAMSSAIAFERRYCTTPATSFLLETPEMAILAPSRSGSYERSLCCLTPIEMVERRQKSLCFNYDEIYTRGHKRWLEVLDDNDHENSSLLTIKGAPG